MSLLNLNKAIKKALSNIAPLDIQNVSLLEANNRVLSNNLKALKSHPPYDNSSMDGYAISFESIPIPALTVPDNILALAKLDQPIVEVPCTLN